MRRGYSVSRSWPPISSARLSTAGIRRNCQPAGSWTTHDYHSIGTNSGNVSGLHQLIDKSSDPRGSRSFTCLSLCVSLSCRELGCRGGRRPYHQITQTRLCVWPTR